MADSSKKNLPPTPRSFQGAQGALLLEAELTPVTPASSPSANQGSLMPKENASSPGVPPAETPDVLPRPDFHFEGQIGRTYRDSDPAQFPQAVTAPKGSP